jgi:hypothetical protein
MRDAKDTHTFPLEDLMKPTIRQQRLGTAVSALALAAGGLIATAPVAHASVGDTTCFVSAQGTFVPNLTAGSTVDVTVDGALTGCNGTTDLRSANVTTTDITATASPLSCLILTIDGTAELRWTTASGDHPTSTVHVHLSLNPADPPVLALNVTAGELAGDSVLAVPVVTLNGTCLTGGLTGITAITGLVSFA